jgi:hypothetical protein
MRFMVMVKSDAKSEAGVMPDEKLLSEMGKLNEEMTQAGVMLAGEGLQPTSKGTRVRYAGGKFTVIDGPFTESKELLGGYWLIQVKSKEEAFEWIKRVPFREGEIEIRQVYEMSDFPADPSERPGGWRDEEQRFRDAAEASTPSADKPVRKPGTTRFMCLLRGDKKTESGVLPDQKVLEEMGELMTEFAKKGALLSGEGLKPTSNGARIRFEGNKRTVIDGPFTESKELIAGFSLIQVKSKEEAIDFSKRWLDIHARSSNAAETQMEIRPLFELSDYAVDANEQSDGWRQKEAEFREKHGH